MHHSARSAILSSLLGFALLSTVTLSPVAGAPPHRRDVPARASRTTDDSAALRIFDQIRSGLDELSTWLTMAPDLDLVGAASAYVQVSLREAGTEMLTHWAPWLAGLNVMSVPDLTVLRANPVPGIESSGYGWRDDPLNRRRKFHRGADYRAPRGTPVYAAGEGVVAWCGRQRGYGNIIYLDHGAGLVTRYAHLTSIDVRRGDHVPAAQRIGRVGATGRTTGPHLHFEVRVHGRAVDPALALEVAELQRSAPELATVAAQGLAPDVQARAQDHHDRTNRRMKKAIQSASRPNAKTRPERRGRAPRDRNLW